MKSKTDILTPILLRSAEYSRNAMDKCEASVVNIYGFGNIIQQLGKNFRKVRI